MMDWGYGGGMGNRRAPQQFVAQYHCSSTAVAGRDVDEGDKVFLPPSALDRLARMNVEYPMLFEITSPVVGKRTHCGVLEFSAEEGYCYMPFWMMENLVAEEGQLITVKNVSLPKATYVKFQAQSVDFLDVTNPRALLEVALRKFTCLTEGDIICIPHASRRFYLEVKEVKPNGAASIIETDCNVDFDEPLGFKDSKYAQYEKKEDRSVSSEGSSGTAMRTLQKARVDVPEAEAANAFKPFAGSAKRIDGKLAASAQQAKLSAIECKEERKVGAAAPAETKDAVPTYQSRVGDKYSKKKIAVSAFGGAGHKLNG